MKQRRSLLAHLKKKITSKGRSVLTIAGHDSSVAIGVVFHSPSLGSTSALDSITHRASPGGEKGDLPPSQAYVGVLADGPRRTCGPVLQKPCYSSRPIVTLD